ncbi:MAG: beta strand repeat-containing protein [Bacteroidia bacterium]
MGNATQKYWVATSAGNYTVAANWSPSGAPSSTDTVIFDGTSSNFKCTLTANVTVTGFQVNSNYTDTVDLVTYSLNITGNSTFSGGSINSGTVNITGTTVIFAGTTFGAKISVNSTYVYLNGSIFNAPSIFSNSANSTVGCNGGNTFNAKAEFIQAGAGGWRTAGTYKDVFKDSLVVNCTNSNGYLTFENDSLYPGKKISVGSSGYVGQLVLENFIQMGSTPQTFTLTGSSGLLSLRSGTVFNGPLSVSATLLYLNGSIFNAASAFTNTGNSTVGCDGGNTFNAKAEFIQTGAGTWRFSQAYRDVFKDSLVVNCTNSNGVISLEGDTLYSGKKIMVGSLGYNGVLALENFIQLGSTAQSFTLTSSGYLSLRSGTVFNGKLNISSPSLSLDGATFKESCVFTNTGSSNVNCNGGNIFNKKTEFIQTGAANWSMGVVNPDRYKDSLVLNCTNTSGYVGIRNTTLDSGQKVMIGSSGFTGSLFFMNFVQLGDTSQHLTLTGTGAVQFYTGNVFNGKLSVVSPAIYLDGSVFNDTSSFTQTYAGSSGAGGNTYNARVNFINNGTGVFSLGGTNADTINADASFTNNGGASYFMARRMISNGNLIQDTSVNYGTSGGYLTMNGTSAQTISGANTTIGTLRMNNYSGVQINSNIVLYDSLNFLQGIISTDSTFELENGSVVTGAGSSKFVAGAIAKVGNTAFTFPIGKSSNYHPLVISAPANSTDVFTAEYFNSGQSYGSSVDSSLALLSNCEYWDLARTTGTSSVSVTLGWNASSCSVSTPAGMRVAYWDGTKWKDRGGISPTGNCIIGTITSVALQHAFGHFALSSSCGITVNSDTICAGSSDTLTATGLTSYTWTPSTGLSATAGSVVVATPSVSTIYTVTGTAGSCTSTATSTVTVNPLPTITVTPSPGGMCIGSSTTFTAGGGSTYTWSPGTGLSSTTGSTVTANPTVTTTYTVTGTNTNGCVNTCTVTLYVNANPIVTVNSATICYGDSCFLIAHSLDSACNYGWSPVTYLDLSIQDIKNPKPVDTVRAYPPITTVYMVTATNVYTGCSGTATSTVTVVPTLTVTVNSETIFIGASATLTASGGTTYSWMPGTDLSSTTGYSVVANPTVTTTYTVIGTTMGCSDQAISIVNVIPDSLPTGDPAACYCVSSFAPIPGKKYLISAWAKEDGASPNKTSFTYPVVYLDFAKSNSTFLSSSGPYNTSGFIIDGWQRIEGSFQIPDSAYFMTIRLQSNSGDVFFDDVRVFPYDGSMKSYVYDPVTLRLVAELDERNYATKYEYDEEGKLTRIKKETERGNMTIKESRNNSPKQ